MKTCKKVETSWALNANDFAICITKELNTFSNMPK